MQKVRFKGIWIIDALVDTGLAKSKREARRLIQSGSIEVNGKKIMKERFLLVFDEPEVLGP